MEELREPRATIYSPSDPEWFCQEGILFLKGYEKIVTLTKLRYGQRMSNGTLATWTFLKWKTTSRGFFRNSFRMTGSHIKEHPPSNNGLSGRFATLLH